MKLCLLSHEPSVAVIEKACTPAKIRANLTFRHSGVVSSVEYVRMEVTGDNNPDESDDIVFYEEVAK